MQSTCIFNPSITYVDGVSLHERHFEYIVRSRFIVTCVSIMSSTHSKTDICRHSMQPFAAIWMELI